MSDSDTSRDADTGQYTPSSEGLYGREKELVDAGYTVRKDTPEEKTYGAKASDIREAADDLTASRSEPVELSLDGYREDFVASDPKEALTVEQAAQEITQQRANVATYAEAVNLSNLADSVDKARAAELKANPQNAAALGLNQADLESAKAADDPPEVAAAAMAATVDEQAPPAAEPIVDGLDPEVAKALQNPQVRQALEQEFGRVDAARESYQTALNVASQLAQANLVDHLPELANVPVEQWEAALNILHQQDPQRVGRALNVLQRVSQLSAAQNQWQQQQAQQRQHQFETSVQSEDARLVEMFGGDKKASDAVNDATFSYLAEHGVPRNQMLQVFMNNPVLTTAEARRTIWEAAEYRRIKNATRAVPTLPSVQRPGISGTRSVSTDTDARLASLNRQLASATNDKRATALAAEMLTIERNRRAAR